MTKPKFLSETMAFCPDGEFWRTNDDIALGNGNKSLTVYKTSTASASGLLEA